MLERQAVSKFRLSSSVLSVHCVLLFLPVFMILQLVSLYMHQMRAMIFLGQLGHTSFFTLSCTSSLSHVFLKRHCGILFVVSMSALMAFAVIESGPVAFPYLRDMMALFIAVFESLAQFIANSTSAGVMSGCVLEERQFQCSAHHFR